MLTLIDWRGYLMSEGLIFGGAIWQRVFCITGLGGLYLGELIHGGLIFGILRYSRGTFLLLLLMLLPLLLLLLILQFLLLLLLLSLVLLLLLLFHRWFCSDTAPVSTPDFAPSVAPVPDVAAPAVVHVFSTLLLPLLLWLPRFLSSVIETWLRVAT